MEFRGLISLVMRFIVNDKDGFRGLTRLMMGWVKDDNGV